MTIHTAKLQLISSVGLTKITTESKSELGCLDSGNFFFQILHSFLRGQMCPSFHKTLTKQTAIKD